MLCCFFFFKQKTAYEVRISDWSSDVCSSDLDAAAQTPPVTALARHCALRCSHRARRCGIRCHGGSGSAGREKACRPPRAGRGWARAASRSREVGRAACGERGWPAVKISVGGEYLKKKHNKKKT